MVEFNAFPGGVRHCVTFSFDDGSGNDRKTVVPMLNKYGLKAAFHLNSARLYNKNNTDGSVYADEVPSLYAGHEVSCHTVNHGRIDAMPIAQLTNEIMADRVALEKASGKIVRGMSYPFGMLNDDIITAAKACGIVYGRTVNETFSFKMPSDFMRWHPSAHYLKVPDWLLDMFTNNINNVWHSNLFYIWGHAHELVDSASVERFEALCSRLSNLDNVWYATNIEIYEYITAQRSLVFSADCNIITNPTSTDVWVRVNGDALEIKAGATVKIQ